MQPKSHHQTLWPCTSSFSHLQSRVQLPPETLTYGLSRPFAGHLPLFLHGLSYLPLLLNPPPLPMMACGCSILNFDAGVQGSERIWCLTSLAYALAPSPLLTRPPACLGGSGQKFGFKSTQKFHTQFVTFILLYHTNMLYITKTHNWNLWIR